jgi:cell wall-associated NlpC family hydrolase
MSLDPRLNAFRADLADEWLRGVVAAPRYAAGRPARVVAGVVPVHRAPDRRAEVATFFHYGEAVRVFDDAGGFAWCQSLSDRYVGYVEAGAIATGMPPQPTHFVATFGSYAFEEPDLRAPARDFLPRHSAVTLPESDRVTRGTLYGRLATGLYLPLACLAPAPPRSPDIAAAAALYLGCPYLWGGRSFLGLDCSGLVQSACRDLGMSVPRDTDMQREAIGRMVAIDDLAALQRGDLIYMPGHVLIYAGDGWVIHADGATLTVRRDDLAALIAARGWSPAMFAVRRL